MNTNRLSERWNRLAKGFSSLGCTTIVAVLASFVSILGTLIGTGILLRPEIEVSVGVLALPRASGYELQIMMIGMQYLAESRIEEQLSGLENRLKELGMDDSKTATVAEVLRSGSPQALDGLELEPHEERIAQAAMTTALSDAIPTLLDGAIPPQAVLFFEVRNKGSRSARNVHIVVRTNGKLTLQTLDTDNKLNESSCEPNECRIDLDALSPSTLTRGVIWIDSAVGDQRSLRNNTFTVSYDDGSVFKDFEVDQFYLR